MRNLMREADRQLQEVREEKSNHEDIIAVKDHEIQSAKDAAISAIEEMRGEMMVRFNFIF